MRRNLLLFAALILGMILIFNNSQRLLSFRGTSKEIEQSQARLEALRKQNEVLRGELEYKQSNEFAEGEIRNKLGLAKEGETVVILPKNNDESLASGDQSSNEPNYVKWWNIFFGG